MTSGVPWQVTRASSRARQAARDAARVARAAKSTALADQLLALESRIGAAKLSVMPDPGGRSDLIAAARRAAQAGADVATTRDASVIQPAVRVPAGGTARLHVLIGATAAILIVLGLLQIVRIALNPSTETALVTPGYVAPDVVPSDVRELARGGEPAFAASAAPPLHPGSASDPEVTGKVPLSTGTTASAAAVAVRPVPSVVGTNLDLAMPPPGQ
jgi:hypothetical protein